MTLKTSGLTRRSFLQSSASVAAGAALTSTLAAPAIGQTQSVRVLSGL